MTRGSHPILQSLLLVAIALRVVFGAPCCLEPLSASANPGAHNHHAAHAHHAQAQAGVHDSSGDASGDHSDHTDSPSANPCCSACGPTIPAEVVQLAARLAPTEASEAQRIRALATRPPYPAYEARGPPRLI